ncbi:MAG: tripartite tricarboxylate transporter TctB family protein [Paracoccaceae bacterium]
MNDPDTVSRKLGKARNSVGAQLVIPAASVALALYFFTTIIDSPWTAQVSAFMIGFILIALCLALFAKIAVQVKKKRADLRMTELFTAEDLTNGRVVLFAFTFGYILLINWAGFTITTFLFLFLSMVVLNNGRRKLVSAIIAGLMSLGGWGLFILAFDTRFPRGPFENLMEAVLQYGF